MASSIHGRDEKFIQNFDKKTEGESLGISRRIILKWIVQEIGSEEADKIHLAEKRIKCTLVQVLRLCTGHMAHRGSRSIALLIHDQRH